MDRTDPNFRELESTPLFYRSNSARPWHRALVRRCNLPSEKTIAGVILAMFVLVILLLLTMQNMTASWSKTRDFNSNDPLAPLQHLLEACPRCEDFKMAWREGQKLVQQREALELLLVQIGVVPEVGSATERLQSFLKRPVRENISKCSVIVEHVKRTLGECVNRTYLPPCCDPPKPFQCDPNARYRSYNGSCNNLNHPTWGMSETAIRRLLEPDYADGVSVPRMSTFGGRLPSARSLSAKLYSHKTSPNSNLTLMGMNFGLFIDHNIIRIAPQNGQNGSDITCCDPRVIEKTALRHPECLEIDVPGTDPFYGPLNVTCLDFVRSKPMPGKCPGQREQMNLVSSYIDGSAVYGTEIDHVEALRSFVNGRLKSSSIHGKLMPAIEGGSPYVKNCGIPKEPLNCFDCGDNRVNEQVDLVAMHSIWFREHNRIADELHIINPNWTDELIFQEARRIVGAEMQHITYNEFLPAVLGDEGVEKYHLRINRNVKYNGYNPNQDASIANVIAAAAFRFGHSLIQGVLDLYKEGYNKTGQVELHKTFVNPSVIYKGDLDMLLRGMAVQSTQTVDSYITSEVRGRLFQPYSGSYGLDLAAFGIQRGRDHGLPGYTKWREHCQLPPVEVWEDLYKYIGKEKAERLRCQYTVVEDIDLIPAALSEHHVPGSMLGPTYHCLLGQQFQATRSGDRFWFETQNKPWSFSQSQLNEIYKSNMARVVCDNSDHIETIQRYALVTPSKRNPMVECQNLPSLNLTRWKV